MAKYKRIISILIVFALLFGIVSVVPVSAELSVQPKVWHNFDNVQGSTISDASGNNNSATAYNVTYVDSPMGGKAASLSGSASYLQLTSGLFTGWSEFTFASWVNINEVTSWARIFDFGSDTTNYMYFVPSDSSNTMGNTIFSITGTGYSGEQRLTTQSPFSTDKWSHVAFTLGDNTATLYVDGIKIAENANITNTPGSALGTNTSNYIGKSHYSADGYLKAQFDDLRVYDTALTQAQIAEVMAECYPEIESIEKVEITTDIGVVPELPDEVKVKYKNGTQTNVAVKWDSITSEQLIGVTELTVYGTLVGTSERPVAVIKINNASLSKDYLISNNVGFKYTNSKTTYGNFSILNNTNEKRSLMAILAVYDESGNMLISDKTIAEIEPDSTKEVSVEIELPDELLLSCAKVKGFVWGGDGYYIPVAEASEKAYQPMTGGEHFSRYDVQLLDGIFEESQQVGKDYLLSFDIDRLLAPLYLNTPYTSPAQRYGGWESSQLASHSIGHYMSACANMYAQTGDERFKEILNHAVEVMAEIQNDDGFIGGFDRKYLDDAFDGIINAAGGSLNGCWAPWYTLHKIYQGLIDTYLTLDNEQALDVAEKLAEYAMNGCDRLTDTQMQTMLVAEHGGMMETFVDLYNITGDERYLENAERWTHHAITDSLAEGTDSLTGRHGNTQIPKLIGNIKYYQATGDEYHLNAAKNFWDYVVNDRSYIIGGNTRSEHFDAIGTETLAQNNCETCNSFNMLKLTAELFEVSHDEKYIEYYETVLYNHILGSQDPDSGAKMYFIPLTPGQFKTYCDHDNSFWCCTGTGFENPSKYSDLIYYKDNSEFYVNMFIASSVDWEEKDMKLTQITDFPNSESSKLVVLKANGANAAIKVRVPSWTKNMTVKVNGEVVTAQPVNGYISVERAWNIGDIIDISVPMHVYEYYSRETDEAKDIVGFKYGPLVLAGRYGTQNMPSNDITGNNNVTYASISVNPIVTDETDPASYIKKDEGSLTFTFSADQLGNGKSTSELIPFYAMHHERYTVYWTRYTTEQFEAAGGIPESFESRLQKVTIDTVEPNHQQSEIDHDYQMIGDTCYSTTGYLDAVGCAWRDLKGIGSINYTLAVDDSKTNYLLTVLWGSDGPYSISGVSRSRMFDIIVDGQKLATYTLNSPKPNELFYLYYEIPAELIEGKDTVRVTYQSNSDNTTVGGLFGVRTTTDTVQP